MTPADTMRAAVEALHQQIMNLPCKVPDIPGANSDLAYKIGHRDARHAAAELVLASIPPNTPAEAGKVGVADGVMASDGGQPK